jgi:hypothetical protein
MIPSAEQKNAERLTPRFYYEFVDFKDECIMTFVPIHVGEFVTLRVGGILKNRKVKGICHAPRPDSWGEQILVASIEFENE